MRASHSIHRLCVLALAAALPSLAFAQDAGTQERVFGQSGNERAAFVGRVYRLPPNTGRLPQFESLEPIATLGTDTIDVPVRNYSEGFPGFESLIEWFGIEYEGQFETDGGCFEFRLYSDDGSRLFIDQKLVIDNDGVHGPRSVSSRHCLDKGSHSIRVQYFQGPAFQIALQLFYRAEGQAEQAFPGTAFRPDRGMHWLWAVLAALMLGSAGWALSRRRPQRELDRVSTDANLNSVFNIHDPEASLALRIERGRGLSARTLAVAASPSGLSTTLFSATADTRSKVVEQDFVHTFRQQRLTVDPQLRAPTEELVKAWLASFIVSPTGDPPRPPAAGPNLARAPQILWLHTEQPYPGGTLYIVGNFDEPESAEVTFEPVGPPMARHPAEILARGKTFLRVRIPAVEDEWAVVVRCAGRASDRHEIDIGKREDEQELRGANINGLVTGLLSDLLRHEVVADISRFGHVFSRKQGRFRYLIGSRSGEVMVGNERRRLRWLVLLDGEFKNGYKDATFTISLALVGSGQSDAVLDFNEGGILEWVPVLRINLLTDEQGKKKYTTTIVHPDLANVLGVTWNQDDRSVILDKVLGFDLAEEGIHVWYDTRAKQAGVRLGTPESSLELRAGEEGSTLVQTQREVHVIDGRRHEFTRTHHTDDKGLNTELGWQIPLGDQDSAGNPEQTLRMTLRMPEREAERGESSDLSGRIDLFRAGRAVAIDFSTRDRELSRARFDLNLSGEKDSLNIYGGFERPASGGERWSTGLRAKTEVLRGDVELESGFSAVVDRKRGNTEQLELRADVKVEIEKLLNLALSVEGAYKRTMGRAGGERFEVSATGQIEVLKVELAVTGRAYWEGSQRGAEVELGLDLMGLGKQALKLADQPHENTWLVWRRR
jgi:hypothetical protein